MRKPLILVTTLLLPLAAAAQQERATGPVVIERQERSTPERSREVILERERPAARTPERATGETVIERREEPRGIVIERDGARVEVPRGAVEIRGANVEVIEEERVTRLTIRNDVLFDFDRSELRGEAREALERVADMVRQRRPARVRVVGHTDSVGNDAYNLRLSEGRALSVARWLQANGGAMPQIVAEGRGESEPAAQNVTADGRDNPDGRQRNRRVDVLLER